MLRLDIERLLDEARQLLDPSTQSWTSAGATRSGPNPLKAVRMLPRKPPSSASSERCGPTATPKVQPGRSHSRGRRQRQQPRPIARRLVHEGHDVAVAGSGLEALVLLEKEGFDLILLDLLMPDMNGVEVLERLKSDKRWRSTPVIMISG